MEGLRDRFGLSEAGAMVRQTLFLVALKAFIFT